MKIVITGPESTGKSTLVKDLAKHFSVPFVEEYARIYLELNGPDYEYEDLLRISKEQQIQHEVQLQKRGIVICDTDLLTIQIWSEVKYGKCDPWITSSLENSLPALYLLCFPDVDWILDELRENPNDRDVLFKLYEKQITKLNVPYTIISGPYANRFIQAREVVQALLEK